MRDRRPKREIDLAIFTNPPGFEGGETAQSCSEMPTVREMVEFFGRVDSLETLLLTSLSAMDSAHVLTYLEIWKWLWLDTPRRLTALDAEHRLDDVEVLRLLVDAPHATAALQRWGLLHERVVVDRRLPQSSCKHSFTMAFPRWLCAQGGAR